LQDVLSGISIDHKARTEINELTDTLRGNLDKVVQHGKRADSIVKNMLLHSRQGSGEHRPVDINALVEESRRIVAPQIAQDAPSFVDSPATTRKWPRSRFWAVRYSTSRRPIKRTYGPATSVLTASAAYFLSRVALDA
jgi:hypothetical protein